MIKWLLYLPFALLSTLLCYLTNPIVVLFADEQGELDGLLHLWQTWDDSLDSEFFMHNVCPSWLDYGYDDHYVSYRDTDAWTAEYGKTRQFSVLRQGCTWTTKQRLQRYICRVWWLTRNCAYGWCFFVFGADMTGVEWETNEPGKFYGKNDDYFVYKNEQLICSWLRWKIYLGWKTFPGNEAPQRCMLAYRFFVSIED